jgi:hypothetical protein
LPELDGMPDRKATKTFAALEPVPLTCIGSSVSRRGFFFGEPGLRRRKMLQALHPSQEDRMRGARLPHQERFHESLGLL